MIKRDEYMGWPSIVRARLGGVLAGMMECGDRVLVQVCFTPSEGVRVLRQGEEHVGEGFCAGPIRLGLLRQLCWDRA